MKPKGTTKGRHHLNPLQEAVKELLEHPRQLSGEGEGPSPEKMVTRFQQQLRNEVLRPVQGYRKPLTGTPGTTVFWLFRAAAILAVFSAGYLTGTRGIREGMTDPSALVSEEITGVFTEHTPAETVPAAVDPEGTILVRLVFEAPEARSVTVAADWNQWRPETHPLTDEDGDGVWEIHLRLQRGRDYQYQFVIDGSQWVADPGARVQIDDGFGGVNSLLNI